MPRVEERGGVVPELEEAALPAEYELASVVGEGEALGAGGVDVDVHAAHGVLVGGDGSGGVHGDIVARSQIPVIGAPEIAVDGPPVSSPTAEPTIGATHGRIPHSTGARA